LKSCLIVCWNRILSLRTHSSMCFDEEKLDFGSDENFSYFSYYIININEL